MPLIPIADVQTRFPRWNDFVPDEAELTRRVEDAEGELAAYVVATDLDAQTDLALIRLIKKHCFDHQHGDTEFERRPQILRDYDKAIADLERLRGGELPDPAPEASGDEEDDDEGLDSKPRRFGSWFR